MPPEPMSSGKRKRPSGDAGRSGMGAGAEGRVGSPKSTEDDAWRSPRFRAATGCRHAGRL